MILHQQVPHPAAGPPLPWIAVHCASLGIASCQPMRNGTVHLRPLPHPAATLPIRSEDPPVSFPIAEIAADLQHAIPGARLRTMPEASPQPLPPYILLNSTAGDCPAIMHTQDPVAIYLANPRTGILGPACHFAASTDLPVEGWTYWYEDAMEHYARLTLQSSQDLQTVTPDFLSQFI